jgi:hypothetical protein
MAGAEHVAAGAPEVQTVDPLAAVRAVSGGQLALMTAYRFAGLDPHEPEAIGLALLQDGFRQDKPNI